MTEQPSDASRKSQADLQELPPSAKLVAKILEYEGSLTQAELAEETLLPTRTLHTALSRLEEQGLVSARVSFLDGRQRVYSLTGDGRRS